MIVKIAPQFVVFACDESGAKGYADRDEQSPGEVGVFVGILVPNELLSDAQARFDAIAKKYETSPGKVHITDLTLTHQEQLRKEVFDLIEQLRLPCFFEATHVAGFHVYFQRLKDLIENAKLQRRSRIKLSANVPKPGSLHEALFFGLYSRLLAFCMERGKPLLHIEVRTDQVDAPIFRNFQTAAKSLLEYGAKIQTVTGYDPDTKTVLKGTVQTPAVLPAQQLPITITQLDFKRITTLDGLVLAADVLANSLSYHYRMRVKGERYRRLNKPDALEGHPLFRSLDAFRNWGTFDVSDGLYAHPCDPDLLRQLPLWKRSVQHIRCAVRWLKLHFIGHL
jgi:hypothetical protein